MAGSARIRPANSMPSMSGMCQSRITASKGSFLCAARRSLSRASGPLSAVSCGISQAMAWLCRISRLVALSSTINSRTPRRSLRVRAGSRSATITERARGTLNQKVEPLASSLSTPISPPISATS